MMFFAPILGFARLIPWQAWALAGVLIAASVYHWRATSAAYERGKADATLSITNANRQSQERAHEGHQDVDSCFAAGGSWNRSRGLCHAAPR